MLHETDTVTLFAMPDGNELLSVIQLFMNQIDLCKRNVTMALLPGKC